MSTQKTVLIIGNFLVLHPGHLRLFQFAKEIGQKLIIGILSDQYQTGARQIPEHLRLESVQSNILVDECVIVDKPVQDFLRELKPDIVLKGKEHENAENVEEQIVQEYGGTLMFCSGETNFSTTTLLEEHFTPKNLIDIRLPEKYVQNHSITPNSLVDIVNQFSNLNIAVIGDIIVDEYIECQPLGMSQEDPCIAVSPLQSKQFVGGAGIVARHAARLGGKVNFISISGNDPLHDYVKGILTTDVNTQIYKDISRPTTLKQRFRASGKSLLRVNKLHQNSISIDLQNHIYKYIEGIIDTLDLLVLSDFNYGCLPDHLVEKLIHLAKQHDVFIAADSQSSSQIGNINRFKGVNLITPTEREARIALHDNQSGLVVLADKVSKETFAEHILLKMGGDGILIYRALSEKKDTGQGWTTDTIPALNPSPVDVAGAGDSMLIATSMALSLGASIWEAAAISSYAAAIQVSRLGNTPLNKDALLRLIQK